jgi:phage FluMu protein Com
VSKCAKCQELFAPNEFFIRTADYRRYHPDCFRCDHCDRLLVSGDEYYLHGQHQIFCREDFQRVHCSIDGSGTTLTAAGNAAVEREEAEERMACIHTDIRSDVTMA